LTEPQLSPVVFLDRDGTLNRDTRYLHSWDDWEWLPGVCDGLGKLQQAGFRLIVVSNQAGVARGFYGEADIHRLHERVNAELWHLGVHIDAFYYCPHHPDFTGPCSCRKPEPGMLLRAEAEMNIDLQRSWLIGDAYTDMKAALSAGCRPILVLSGNATEFSGPILSGVTVCDNFMMATQHILKDVCNGLH